MPGGLRDLYFDLKARFIFWGIVFAAFAGVLLCATSPLIQFTPLRCCVVLAAARADWWLRTINESYASVGRLLVSVSVINLILPFSSVLSGFSALVGAVR